jgi:hypothetical protein
MSHPLVSAMLVAAVMAVASCADPAMPVDPGDPADPPPTQPPTMPPTEHPPVVASLELIVKPTLEVHESALITVIARDSAGNTLPLTTPPALTSSNPGIASISDGVISTFGRGSVTIGAGVGAVRTTATVHIQARVKIALEFVNPARSSWSMAVGDMLRLAASYVDVNGSAIPEIPAATWSSSNSTITVSADGVVVSHQAFQSATITATTPDGQADMSVSVSDAIAGEPAVIRFAHTMSGVGPVTFQIGTGAGVTLGYGESAKVPVLSGTVVVRITGLPVGSGNYTPASSFGALIRGGDHMTLYVTGDYRDVFLTPTWPAPAGVSADSGLVRLVQSSGYGVVYLRATGAAADGQPELCYFDPGDPSQYFTRAAGGFDLLLQPKYTQNPETIRLATAAPAGQSVTMVLVGYTAATAAVLTFPDF